MKKIKLLAMAAVVVSLLVGSTLCYAEVSFKDIKSTNWAYPYVSKLVELGGINGYNDGTFKPSNTITNAEFIKIVIGATVGEQVKTGTHWASGYMDEATELGVLEQGEIVEADYNKSMTRELMAAIVARTAEKILKEDIECVQQTVVAESIKDYGSIKTEYKDAVIDVYVAGIINGYSDGKFKPRDTATRAEAATMLVRLLEKEQRKEYKPSVSASEVPIETMIESTEGYNKKLAELQTCVADTDTAKYEMKLVEYVDKWSGETKYLVDARYVYSTIYFIKDKKIVGADGIMTDIDGYTNFGWEDGDITTIDYIGSFDAYTDILTLIPNPFKK